MWQDLVTISKEDLYFKLKTLLVSYYMTRIVDAAVFQKQPDRVIVKSFPPVENN